MEEAGVEVTEEVYLGEEEVVLVVEGTLKGKLVSGAARWITGAGNVRKRRVLVLGVELLVMLRKLVTTRRMVQPGVENQEVKEVEAEARAEEAMAGMVKGRKEERRYMNLNKDTQKS